MTKHMEIRERLRAAEEECRKLTQRLQDEDVERSRQRLEAAQARVDQLIASEMPQSMPEADSQDLVRRQSQWLDMLRESVPEPLRESIEQARLAVLGEALPDLGDIDPKDLSTGSAAPIEHDWSSVTDLVTQFEQQIRDQAFSSLSSAVTQAQVELEAANRAYLDLLSRRQVDLQTAVAKRDEIAGELEAAGAAEPDE